MKVYDEIIEKVEVVRDCLCNRCGKSQMPGKDQNVDDIYGLPPTYITAGYFSEAFDDGKRFGFSLCEACLKKIFSEFTIPPDEEDTL